MSAFTLRKAGDLLAQRVEGAHTTPGATPASILAISRQEPRSLKMRTWSPLVMPRDEASLAWILRKDVWQSVSGPVAESGILSAVVVLGRNQLEGIFLP